MSAFNPPDTLTDASGRTYHRVRAASTHLDATGDTITDEALYESDPPDPQYVFTPSLATELGREVRLLKLMRGDQPLPSSSSSSSRPPL